MQALQRTVNAFNPKYLEWYSPCLDLEHTIQVCRGERVKNRMLQGYDVIMGNVHES